MIAIDRNEKIEVLKIESMKRIDDKSALITFDRAVSEDDVASVFETLQTLVAAVQKHVDAMVDLEPEGNA